MRRISVLLVAAGYGLSFLVVCLGTCFAAAPVAEHACCDGEDGFRAAAFDCCFVTPGACTDGPAVAGMGAVAVSLSYEAATSYGQISPHPQRPTLAASPPLVLRI
jgi:hypothetical protein